MSEAYSAVPRDDRFVRRIGGEELVALLVRALLPKERASPQLSGLLRTRRTPRRLALRSICRFLCFDE
jgi:hypothetical protein